MQIFMNYKMSKLINLEYVCVREKEREEKEKKEK